MGAQVGEVSLHVNVLHLYNQLSHRPIARASIPVGGAMTVQRIHPVKRHQTTQKVYPVKKHQVKGSIAVQQKLGKCVTEQVGPALVCADVADWLRPECRDYNSMYVPRPQ